MDGSRDWGSRTRKTAYAEDGYVMVDDKITVWDWLVAKWNTARWKKAARLIAAGVLAAAGAAYLAVEPQSGNWIPLFAAGVVLLILGLRIEIPDQPLPVVPDQPESAGEEPPQAGQGAAAEGVILLGPPAGEAAVLTATAAPPPAPPAPAEKKADLLSFLRLPLAIVAALSAQWVMDFRPMEIEAARNLGWILYIAAFLLLGWALFSGDAAFVLELTRGGGKGIKFNLQRVSFMVGALFFGLLAYVGSTGGMFSLLGLGTLAIALIYWLLALAEYAGGFGEAIMDAIHSAGARLRSTAAALRNGITLSPWSLLVVLCFAALVFTRTVGMDSTPPEMTSDHIEKLDNVVGIFEGKPYIFFANNGGREPLEFYLIALVSQVLGTGISFLSLKIVSIAVGILTLPFLYLLGRELADRRVGLLAMILGGLGYWPDMISRIGLRLPLAMLFCAATLYFFYRAIRRRRWNDFLWAGIALGIGMYGYTPMRLVPLALAVITGLFLIHPSAKGSRRWALTGFLVTLVTMVLLFIPFLRYAVDFPNDFWLRTFTRMWPETGEPLQAPLKVFFGNLWNAMQMFSWNDGAGWFACIPLRPALDVVTGAFFHLGFIGLIFHAVKKRSWEALSLILLVPILLLPSILALAIPGENPSLARAIAAVPAVFLLPALAMVLTTDFLRTLVPGVNGRRIGAALLAVLVAAAAAQDFDLTLRQYPASYRLNAENASELGTFMRRFAQTIGQPEDAYFIPFPYWVDHRIVNVYAGMPINSEQFVWPDDIPAFPFSGRPTLFLLLAEDTGSLEALKQRFPDGYYGTVVSAYPTRDFVYFIVPGTPNY
jgi:hypothetical protein